MNDIVAPYLEIEGIAAAAMVSAQGFLVASAGTIDLNLEALAAYVATIMSSATSLANELDAGLLKSVSRELPGRVLSLARVSDDLFLVLVGDDAGVLAQRRALAV
ncbi:MAG: roadblock/LC7 domain-containing protein [Thermoleophilia bacterium]|nr:roadblock/LC7 domain-containing protein [Thermoleophilia bacterium]